MLIAITLIKLAKILVKYTLVPFHIHPILQSEDPNTYG
jgi:hypothetical protein